MDARERCEVFMREVRELAEKSNLELKFWTNAEYCECCGTSVTVYLDIWDTKTNKLLSTEEFTGF